MKKIISFLLLAILFISACSAQTGSTEPPPSPTFTAAPTSTVTHGPVTEMITQVMQTDALPEAVPKAIPTEPEFKTVTVEFGNQTCEGKIIEEGKIDITTATDARLELITIHSYPGFHGYVVGRGYLESY